MEYKLENNAYPELSAFVADAQLVLDNCRTYNPEGSVYAKNADRLEKFMREWLADKRKDE